MIRRALGIAAALFALTFSVHAQPYQVLGKAKCVNCHDHEAEKLWSEKKDGPPPANHLNALNQLESPKSAGFAKAVGVTDPYDPRSSCVSCHGTVLKGAVVDGVTCETCHGAGSGYVDLHQQKGAYRPAVAAGLTDTVKNPDAWAPMCIKCHVLSDSPLIQAGHPSGDDFDLGAKFGTVALHWKSVYPNKADITARSRAARATIVATRRPLAAPPATATAAAAPTAAPPPTAPAPAPAAAAGPAAVTSPRPATMAPTAPAVALRPPMPAVASHDIATPIVPAAKVAPPELAFPSSPSAAVAALQGRILMMLDGLLRRDGRSAEHVALPAPPAYHGPDADLLRLQNDVLSLAVDALAVAPRKP